MKIAKIIFKNNVWAVSNLRAVYMADNFDLAKSYAKKKGGIVVLKKSPHVNLKKVKHLDGAYYFPIDDAKPGKEFFHINGLTPIAILDSNRKLVAGSLNY
jgi:hypothetical protein